MPTLDEIEAKVAALNDVTGNIFNFRDALNDIVAASQNGGGADLISILSDFRNKIPDLIAFNRIRADARDLQELMMHNTVQTVIARIRARNDVLTELSTTLQTQIDGANSDASLLTRIKEGVERATKTAAELKALVNQLQATDSSTVERITALIDGIDSISTILQPAA